MTVPFAHSIRDRLTLPDPLNHLHIELLQRYRSGQTDLLVRRAPHITIIGIATGMRNGGWHEISP